MELRDKHVWLIGASTGIGAELAPQLAAKGALLALSARGADGLRGVAKRCGPETIVLPLDVTDVPAIARAAATLIEAWEQIDVLIYNAGAWAAIDVERFDADAFDRQIDVNYRGMAHAIGAVLPDMLRRRSGEIVGVASLSAYGAFPRAEAYGSTKAAVNHMLSALRMDLRRHGVGVTTVNPGFVRTELTAHNDFPMPFMLDAGDAARRIVEGLEHERTEIHFPRRLSLPLKLLAALPRPLYEFLVSRATRR